MSNLSNQYISASYQSVLNVGTGSGDFISSTLKPITDGYGTQVPLKLSTLGVELSGSISLTGSLVSSIIPAVSNSVDLGSPTKPFRHIYAGSGSIYLDGNSILSLDTPGTDTVLASPPSGTVQLVNDIVFSSQEGLGYEGAPGFTIVGGGTNFQSQTRYSGDTISYHTGSYFTTNYWVNNINQITGDTSLELDLFKDNLKLATIENSRHLPTYYDSQYEINSIYEGTGSYNGAIRIKHTDLVNNEYSELSVGDDYVQMVAGDLTGSSPIPKANLAVFENEIVGYFTNSPSSASFTLTGSLFEVTGAIKATDGYVGNIQGTASFATSASHAVNSDLAITASQALNSNTADVATVALDSDLLQGTGSGVFATTGSNTFNGSQTISGSLNVTGSITALSASITYLETIYQTSSVIYTSGSNVLGDEAGDVQTLNGTVNIPLGNLNVTGATTASAGFFGNLQGTASFASNALSASQAQNAVSASQSVNSDASISSSFAQNAVSSSHSLNADNAISASQAQNAVSASQSVNSDNAVSASQAQQSVSSSYASNADLLDGKDSSEFAITGSNNFIGVESITGSLNVTGSVDISGSVALTTIQPNPRKQNLIILSAPNVTTSSAVLNNYLNAITTSLDNDDVNFVIPAAPIVQGTLGLANQTGSIFISGSNNILINLGSTQPAATGRRQVFGTGNIGTGFVSVNTSSLTIPFINNNFIGNQITATYNTGSNIGNSAHGISNNLMVAGVTLNHPSASITSTGQVTSFSNNIVAGPISSNMTGLLLSNASNIANNIIGGTNINLNHISSSINFTANIVAAGGANNINNLYFQTGSNNNLTVSSNIFGGQAITVNAGGSPSTNVARTLVGNLIGGQNAAISLEASGTDLGGLRNSLVWGGALIVSGSNSAADNNQSSVFVGRFNGQNDGLADSRGIILAVGTGTGTSNRRTGFYITSGSLVGVSGSFDVKGNTTLTGSLDVTGSVTIANAGDLTMYGHKMFNGAQYSTLQTLSGSANVSASVYFDTTGPQYGISLVDNTKLTVANAGTYNIQFSAQLLADTGADDVHIWFKKNGTNIDGSATRMQIDNNAESLMSVNLIDNANANDYYEIAWQSVNGDVVLLHEAASGNIPAVPSVITTITQVR